MYRKSFFFLILSAFLFISVKAQTNSETVMILPFENTSNQAEFNWVGESFASSLTELLEVPSLSVISNQERKIIQQKLGVPLTILPSTATSLKMGAFLPVRTFILYCFLLFYTNREREVAGKRPIYSTFITVFLIVFPDWVISSGEGVT